MARVLVVGPHPDDQELGMGATIARLAAQGHDVLLIDATNGEPTPLGDPATRANEARAALEVLSAPARSAGHAGVRRVCLGLSNREVTHSIEARRLMASVIRAHQSEIIFTPYFEDAHPDHLATTRIVEDARFDAKLSKLEFPRVTDAWTSAPIEGVIASAGANLPPGSGGPIYPCWLFYYYCTHLRHVAQPSFILDATGYEATKRGSIVAYHTQFVLPEKNRRIVEWVDAAMTYFGSRIGTPSGEAFFTREPVGLSSLDSLCL
ncbi:MAG: PIG-L family deacetylase [Phycisphaerales bacterium]|jgi:LmbE family N-acetylglucosaminyl deacetylase|nr:PIG-L family deacetylase [Phycisphaerales bacterium]